MSRGFSALLVALALLGVGATSALAHNANSSSHLYEGVSYHNMNALSFDCSWGNPVYPHVWAKDFDSKSHSVTRLARDWNTGATMTRTDNFIGSINHGSWATYSKVDFAQMQTNWHTWFDSFGAETQYVLGC